MSKRLFLHAAAAAAGSILLPACGGGGGDSGSDCRLPSGNDSLLQRLQQDGRFSALLQAVQKAGLEGTLDDRGANLTLFAPDNAAFDRLGSRIGLGDRNGVVAGLSAAQWNDILRSALLPQRRSLCSLTPAGGQDIRPQTLYTFPTGDVATLIFVKENSGPVNVWDGVGRFLITFQESDLGAINGVMHVPSDVLLPRYVLTVSQMLRANVDAFSNFAESIPGSDITLLDSGGATEFFTVFVPFNPTFAPPLSSTQRRHHVVRRSTRLLSDDFPASVDLTPEAGQTWTLRKGTDGVVTIIQGDLIQARVTDVDFYASNGVIHVIDSVIPL